jgi:hypothetical protein
MEISGFECVEALRLAGFRVVERAAGSTVLRRASRVVIVPDALVLAPDVLASVLGAAGMSESGFRTLVTDAPTLTKMQSLVEGSSPGPESSSSEEEEEE